MDGINEVTVDDRPQVRKCIHWSGELDNALVRLAELSREEDGKYYLKGLGRRWTEKFSTVQANETTLAARLSELRKPGNIVDTCCSMRLPFRKHAKQSV